MEFGEQAVCVFCFSEEGTRPKPSREDAMARRMAMVLAACIVPMLSVAGFSWQPSSSAGVRAPLRLPLTAGGMLALRGAEDSPQADPTACESGPQEQTQKMFVCFGEL